MINNNAKNTAAVSSVRERKGCQRFFLLLAVAGIGVIFMGLAISRAIFPLSNSQPTATLIVETAVPTEAPASVTNTPVLPTITPTEIAVLIQNTPDILLHKTIRIRINHFADDVEERVSDGDMYVDSTDIEIGDDPNKTGAQVVGLRFNGLEIPQGATISNAYIEFEADNTDSVATSVTITGEMADNAAAFSTDDYNLTNRAQTTANVTWNNIQPWNVTSQKHQTPDLTAIVQEVVNRSGWAAGNSMVFIIDGDGTRRAEAYDGESANAPLLHVEFNYFIKVKPSE